LNIPCIAHKSAANYLLNPDYNLSAWFEPEITVKNFQTITDGTTVSLEANPEVQLKMIYTPGHTQDAVIYYDAKNHLAFVGDTIFQNSRGRTDIPGGDDTQLLKSITEKVLTLPNDTILYSGHSAPTTVKAEKPHYHQ
jgi:glyoxylase-like metal-dependent hydrolase (beta-lactamase superfamily II)